MKVFEKFIFILLCVAFSRAENLISNGKVCDGVDAKNIKELTQLEGCQIIEGSVKISFTEKLTSGDFDNLTFPLVTEIAGYLMIYKVSGLKSIAQLFPNLGAIRGGELFKDYAMVVYGNPDLENIGLNHLKGIMTGAVRIEKNEMLCYVNTVDWNTIMSNETYASSWFEENKPISTCEECEKGIKKCWSQTNSQLDETRCEPSCLSCLDDDAKTCTVCKKFIAGIYPSQKCVKTCPYRTHEYLNHRCITTQECKNLNINKKNDPPFIPFRGICQEGCPFDFQIKYAVTGNKMSASCTPCLEKECWRKCKPVLIDSVEAAEALKGCQIIEGSLEIQIKPKVGVNIEDVLENSLSDIIEIENYLKISRSFPLISLKFLKNLKVIHGTQLEGNKYSIVIWDNENLEKLFDENQKLEVKSGKLFVHFNPKLCFDNVDKLSKSISQAIENLENAQLSNGDKAHCNVSNIEVELLEVLADSARIKWKPLKIDEAGAILEYVIFYIIAPEQNIELWNSRDTCGNDGWTATDVDDFPSNTNSISFNIPHLQAFTQYAYYIKAYTSSKAQTGAQSEILYFTTLPDKPEIVESFEATQSSDSEIVLSWTKPKRLNGELEKYEIEIRKLQVTKDFLKQRNFCEQPFEISELKHEENFIEGSTVESSKNAPSTLDFEDEIQNLLRTRNKRASLVECPQEVQKTEMENLLRLEIVGPEQKEFVITALNHFSSYAISIRACRKENNSADEHMTDDLCSDDIQIVAKTLQSDMADIITDFDVTVLPSNTSEHQVKMSWNPPVNPNGQVLNYVVHLKRIDIAESTTETICISLENRQNACSQIIDKIMPGNYSFQILASTLAGSGNYSSPKYVLIKSVSHLRLITSPAFLSLLLLIAFSVFTVVGFMIYKRNQQPEVVSRFENFDYEFHPTNG